MSKPQTPVQRAYRKPAVPGAWRARCAIVAALAVLALALTQTALATAVAPHTAKCTKATIGGRHVCLAPGQYCAHKYEHQYNQHGLTCKRSGGTYRLAHRSFSF